LNKNEKYFGFVISTSEKLKKQRAVTSSSFTQCPTGATYNTPQTS